MPITTNATAGSKSDLYGNFDKNILENWIKEGKPTVPKTSSMEARTLRDLLPTIAQALQGQYLPETRGASAA